MQAAAVTFSCVMLDLEPAGQRDVGVVVIKTVGQSDVAVMVKTAGQRCPVDLMDVIDIARYRVLRNCKGTSGSVSPDISNRDRTCNRNFPADIRAVSLAPVAPKPP
ncbi:hypothetical protein PoB_003559800 [Plakobranchus ocellatus]|uniref:Uncharacterized protein n=1 Tax=Plakobranchus ocellatus TaxID=259542 RepID=A0AAV4AQJ9_9GAST|nr:hypothetical protein PoB_003559800 [Plakobranchus ocellatus]